MKKLGDKLVITIASRALFDLDQSNTVFENHGIAAYAKYQIEHENEILNPGIAFNLVKKLLALNHKESLVEIILLSRNSADTGLRIFNSIQHYGLKISRAVFTCGNIPYHYAKAFNSHLFLSANPQDVQGALSAGCAAANIFTAKTCENHSNKLNIAFDGDAVLFSDESERIYHEQGLEAFVENEKKAAKQPLKAGPFRGFLVALQRLQSHFETGTNCPLRTALVTARSAPAHERVIRTLRAWNIRIDEALFLGGLDKAEFLRAFNADIFFDDQHEYCTSASQYVPTGHVLYGVKNEKH